MDDNGIPCPRHYWPVAIFLAGYLLLGNILLVNLLIAIFSHVFEEVEKDSLKIWKYEMWYANNGLVSKVLPVDHNWFFAQNIKTSLGMCL